MHFCHRLSLTEHRLSGDNPPPYYNGTSNETLPLKGAPRSKTHRLHAIHLVIVLVAAFFLVYHIVDDYRDTDRPSVRARQRTEWTAERHAEELASNETRSAWAAERRSWIVSFESEKVRLRSEERTRAAKEREKESLEWRQSFNATKAEWIETFDATKQLLLREVHKIRADWALERSRYREWEAEREREKENARLDKERRLRSHLAWYDLRPDLECISYGTRMYTATLMNVPGETDGLGWCQDTFISIHGVDYQRPMFCRRNLDVSISNPYFS